jgi:hypothetical protein
MALSVALAGTVVAQLFDAVYAGLASDAYDPNQRLQIALELTRLTVPLLTIQEEIPNGDLRTSGQRRDVPVDGPGDGSGATLDP